MPRKRSLWRLLAIHPRWIELFALLVVIAVVFIGWKVLDTIPEEHFTRTEVIPVLQAIFGALGFASLLFVWAALRQTTTNSKLVAYHQYFHDLPSAPKVIDLYGALERLGIPVPEWYSPLTDEDARRIRADNQPGQIKAHLAVREYLNDFEEFSAAVNSGLVDEEYAYQIEGPRVLRAYYGFYPVIASWLHDEMLRVAKEKVGGQSHYYSMLGELAEAWKTRKEQELAKERKKEGKRGVDRVL